jgi:uncharacterized membrane protein YecN with MAPEG domain
MTTTIVCIALLSALLFILGFNVSRLRGKSASQQPTAMDDPLFVAIRAHGNAAEYIPTLAVLMLVVGSHDPAIWMLVAIVVATAARFVHAVGVLRAGDMSQPVPLRMIGAITTYLAGLALSVAAVLVL